MGIIPSGQEPFFAEAKKAKAEALAKTDHGSTSLPVGTWSTDPTQVVVNGQTQNLVYVNSQGNLVVNSSDAGGNSAVNLSDIYAGEPLSLSFNMSLNPPLSASNLSSYDRLSLYYTYTNTQGQKVQLSVPIQVNASGQYTIPFTIPKDAAPGTVTITLHHEKDWGGTPESAIFSNLKFSSGPTPPADPVSAWSQAIMQGSSAVRNLISQTQGPISDILQVIQGEEAQYQTLSQEYAKNPSSESLYNQLLSLRGSIQQNLNSVSQAGTLFEGQLQNVLTSSLAQSIITDPQFTGSASQMQEIWDYITQQQIGAQIQNLPAVPAAPNPPSAPTDPISAWSQAIMQGSSAVRNLISQTQGPISDILQVIQGEEAQYQTLSQEYAKNPSSESLYNQLLSLRGSIQQNLNSVSQAGTLFEGQLQNVLTSSLAQSIITDPQFTGSASQMQEIWDYITQQQIGAQIQNLPAVPAAPNPPSAPTDPISAWSQAIMQGSSAVRNLISQTQGPISDILQVIQGEEAQYQTLSQEYAKNPSSESLYNQLLSLRGSIQQNLNSVSQAGTLFEGQLQNVLTSSLAQSIITDPQFTGSASQMQEIWDYITQQQIGAQIQNLPAVPAAPNPPSAPTDPVSAWSQAIMQGSSAVANLVKQTQGSIAEQLQVIQGEEEQYQELSKAYAQNPSSESLYNQLLSLRGSLQQNLNAISQAPSLFEGQLQNVLTSSLAQSIITDPQFTGSSSQMQEIWNYITQQQIGTQIQNLPALPAAPNPPSTPVVPGSGSDLSDLQEYQALASNPQVQQLLSILQGTGSASIESTLYQDYQSLQSLKAQYQKALASGTAPDALNSLQAQVSTASQTMLQRFVNDVYAVIESAPAGSSVAAIGSDYDSAHQQQMLAHVETLVSMLMQPPGQAPVVPSNAYVPPPQISGQNLINPNGWSSNHGTAGSWSNVPGQSPSGDQGGIVIDNQNGQKSDYYNISQTINTNSSGAGQQYLVAAYVQGPIPDGQGDFLPATLSVSGDINYNGVKYSPQTYSDSCGTNQWHLVYFVVTADKANAQLTVNLSSAAGGVSKFSDLQIVPIGSGNTPAQIQQIAQGMYPAPSIAGNPGLGPFPQKQSAYTPGENLMNWPPSIWQNADPKSAYPYWSVNPPLSNLVNAGNGNQAIVFNPTSDMTASSTGYPPVLVPGNTTYTYSCQVTIPNPPGNTFPTLSIVGKDYTTTPPTTVVLANVDPNHDPQLFPRDANGNLIPGTYNISVPINASSMPNAFQIIPTWSAYKGTGSFSVSNIDLTPNDPSVYNQINALNPYDTNRAIYNSQNSTYNASWNFANPYDSSNSAMTDWGMALVGNDISNPQSGNVRFVPGKGIELIDTVNPNGSIQNAGIQSSFMTAPGQPFQITTSVQFKVPKSVPPSLNKPVFALWTYGESQKGDGSPLSHKSAGGGDTDNECDFELCPPNAQYPNGYFRAVTYAGYDAGGKPHSFINIPLQPGCNLWDGQPHNIQLQVNPLANGSCSVTWVVTGSNNGVPAKTTYTYSSSPQDPGYPLGDSSTYLKIATEQPYGWPGYTKMPGTSSFIISSIQYTQEPLPAGVVPPPVSDSDYAYYMPGKGFAYTPFPTDFFGSELESEIMNLRSR